MRLNRRRGIGPLQQIGCAHQPPPSPSALPLDCRRICSTSCAGAALVARLVLSPQARPPVLRLTLHFPINPALLPPPRDLRTCSHRAKRVLTTHHARSSPRPAPAATAAPAVIRICCLPPAAGLSALSVLAALLPRSRAATPPTATPAGHDDPQSAQRLPAQLSP